jgi:hypothetical protein
MNDIQTQQERIIYMEKLLNGAQEAVQKLDLAIENYLAIQKNIDLLEDYYTNGKWMQDFMDLRDGKIDSRICCGVLSEDAIYDLLTDRFRLQFLIDQLEKE